MSEPADIVLDASALLSMLHREAGGEWVEHRLHRAAMSSVNWAEVLQRGLARGVAVEGLREDLEALGLVIPPFTAEDADISANLWASTRGLGLSLGDRACLALAQRLGLPAATADRAWGQLDVGIEVHVVR